MFTGLLDDAAIFPPGNLPLAEAVRAHLAHGIAPYADLVGPLVVSAADLPALGEAIVGLPADDIALSVTVPSPAAVAAVLERTHALRAVHLAVLEVALPDDLAAADVVPMLDAAVPPGAGVEVYVELPRDARRPELIDALAGSRYRAKLRTGGVRAELYPDEAELAAAIVALTRAGVPFKATAGLHHAVRNTVTEGPTTGFEQHGFLNMLVATDAALLGAAEAEVERWLAERNGGRLADRAADLSPATRDTFRSFGTCSITEPVDELADLGLLALEGAR